MTLHLHYDGYFVLVYFASLLLNQSSEKNEKKLYQVRIWWGVQKSQQSYSKINRNTRKIEK